MMADVDTCIVCGEPVPEGQALCWNCRELLRRTCARCKWHDEFTGACCNGQSEHRADFTGPEDCCREWEDAGGKEETLHGCKLRF